MTDHLKKRNYLHDLYVEAYNKGGTLIDNKPYYISAKHKGLFEIGVFKEGKSLFWCSPGLKQYQFEEPFPDNNTIEVHFIYPEDRAHHSNTQQLALTYDLTEDTNNYLLMVCNELLYRQVIDL